MAQYVPAPALVSPAGALPHNPDDADVQTRLPSICVDYLSHDWAEEDVWASWRSMTRKKNEIANGVRLENASWRTWWKQRNKLKTISPETLNWLKDSDVTWLYGPLHTAVEAVPPPKIATTEDKLDLHSGKKPILKHRTLSEILTSQRPSSPNLESLSLTSDDEDDDEASLSSSAEGRPQIQHTKSDTNIVRRGSTRRPSPPRIPIPSLALVGQGKIEHGVPHGSHEHLQDEASSPSGGPAQEKRHISFNTFVEQCISLDEPTSISPDRPPENSDSDDSDDDILEMRSSSSSHSGQSSRPSLSRQTSDPKEHFTIAHIAPTLLKSNETFPAPSPAVVFMPPNSSSSALAGSSRGESGASDSSSPSLDSDDGGRLRPGGKTDYDFPSPIDQAQWDEDDDEFHDFIKGSSGSGSTSPGGRPPRTNTGRVGSVNHYESSPNTSPNNSRLDLPGAAAAQQKPPRRGASIGSTPPSSGTSTPTGGPKANSQPQQPPSSPVEATMSPPKQPGRSILKNRTGASPAASSSPDTSGSYFPDAQSLTGAVAAVQEESGGVGNGGFLAVNAGGNTTAASAEDDEGHRRGRSVSRNSSSSSLVDRASQSRSASSTGTNGPASPSLNTNSGHGGASFFNPQAAAAAPQPAAPAPTTGRAARPPSINTAAVNAAPVRPSSPDAVSEVSTPGDGSREDYWADKVPSTSVEESLANPDEAESIRKNEELAREVMRSFEEGPKGGPAKSGSPADEGESVEEFRGGEEQGKDYVPTESTNPTPHSSPLIAMRPLPNSESTSAASLPHSSGPSGRKAASPSTSSPSGAFAALGLNNTSPSPSGNPPSVPAGSPSGGGVVETAKGLLGALWGMGGGNASPTTETTPAPNGSKRA